MQTLSSIFLGMLVQSSIIIWYLILPPILTFLFPPLRLWISEHKRDSNENKHTAAFVM